MSTPSGASDGDGAGVAHSRDGTSIAFTRRGSGPALILVGGGLDDGSENEPLAAELAVEFTTFNYAGRGRGRSGDTRPYTVAREMDDLAALIEIAGGHAHLLGISSGGMYALEAAGGCGGSPNASQISVARLASIQQPTSVATGGGAWYYEAAADAVAQAVPGAVRVQLSDQRHVVDPGVFAPVLGSFLRGETGQT